MVHGSSAPQTPTLAARLDGLWTKRWTGHVKFTETIARRISVALGAWPPDWIGPSPSHERLLCWRMIASRIRHFSHFARNFWLNTAMMPESARFAEALSL